ncbi:CD83 antigen [Acanthopagrus latus]|uniref:CD83 antigen n=1 Tax=Acanthopagrus latus TaxID=8177 RepID=UPI00187BD8AC|nr:CD83 antigen [Acanthopagrus latus]
MAPALLNLVLLLSLCVGPATCTSIALDTLSTSGSDCVLQCTAVSEPGVQYMAVRWYKVGQPPAPRLSGLLTRDLPNGTTLSYEGVERQVELLGESHNILLSNLTCADSGVYNCHLSAPIGQQNRDGEIRLILTDCPDSNRETLVTDACLVIVATAVLMLALLIYLISYVCLKTTLRDRNKTTPKKETLLDAPLKPLEKKDLMLIYTLGPKSSKTPTLKHICV